MDEFNTNNRIADETSSVTGEQTSELVNQPAEQEMQPIQQGAVQGTDTVTIPGKSNAIAALVLGIISVVTWFFGWGAIIGLVTGIIGLVQASKAKKNDYKDGMQTAGLVLSIIGIVGSGIVLVACVACAGTLGLASALSEV